MVSFVSATIFPAIITMVYLVPVQTMVLVNVVNVSVNLDGRALTVLVEILLTRVFHHVCFVQL